MPNLLDIVKQNMEAQETAPSTDATQQARRLMAAKSGRAVQPMAAQSAIGEAAAVAQTQQGLDQVRQAGQLAAADVTQKQQSMAMQEQAERAKIDAKRNQVMQSAQIDRNRILQQSQMEKQRLSQDQRQAMAEQLATTMRLQDKKYIDALEIEGAKRRLGDDIAFRQELQKSIYQSNMELLQQQFKQQDIAAISERAYLEKLSQIDLSTALRVAENAMADERAAAQIQAVQTGVSSVLKYYDSTDTTSSGKSPKSEQNIPDTGSLDEYGNVT